MRPSRFVSLSGALLICFSGRASAVQPNSVEMAAAQGWTREHLLGEAASLPFSFTFGGRPSAELLKLWPREQSTRKRNPWRSVQARSDAVFAEQGHENETVEDRSYIMELNVDLQHFSDMPQLPRPIPIHQRKMSAVI